MLDVRRKMQRYFAGLTASCVKSPTEAQRIIQVNRGDLAQNKRDINQNAVRNHKYTMLNFFPCMLYEQFSAPMNLFFLMIASLQLWRAISPVHPVTTWTPLIVVFVVASTKAALDDYARRKADAAANARPYSVWRKGVLMERCPAERIAVGDLVQVSDDEEVPCDLLLLRTADVVPDGAAFLETANLDGETDLKLRRARPETNLLTLDQLCALRGRFICDPPNADLYRFDAKLTILGTRIGGPIASALWSEPTSRSSEMDGQDVQVTSGDTEGSSSFRGGPHDAGLPLSLALASASASLTPLRAMKDGEKGKGTVEEAEAERGGSSAGGVGWIRQRSGPSGGSRSPLFGTNLDDDSSGQYSHSTAPSQSMVDLPMGREQLLQHGTVVRRTGHVLGLAVYTGGDTKLNQNRAPAVRKVASIDVEINRYVVAVFTVQVVLVFILGMAGSSWNGNGDPGLWYLMWPAAATRGDGDVTDVEPIDMVFGQAEASVRIAMSAAPAINSAAPEGLIGESSRAQSISRVLAVLLRPSSSTARESGSGLGSQSHAHAWWANAVLPLRFLLLSSMMIPISLKVSLDLAKAWHARLIEKDMGLYDSSRDIPAGVASTTLSEDLGRVGVVLTDKTGTLTENVMRLVGISVGGNLHSSHPSLALHHAAAPFHTVRVPDGSGLNGKRVEDGALLDLLQALALCNAVAPEHVNAVPLSPIEAKQAESMFARNRTPSNVGPSPDGQGLVRFVAESDTDGVATVPRQRKRCLQYASASPDDEALVLGAARLGVALVHRRIGQGGAGSTGTALGEASRNRERVSLAFGLSDERGRLNSAPEDDDRRVWVRDDWTECVWEVLATLPFDSDRKRMSVLVRRVGVGQTQAVTGASGSSWPGLYTGEGLFLVMKGADDAVLPLLCSASSLSAHAEDVQRRTMEHVHACATHGLRTLAVAARRVSQSSALAWLLRWDSAQAEVGPSRDTALNTAMEELERDMVLLGATAIEDKLQEGVPEAIADLRLAGVRCWMVTGDKRATALQIARAASLLGNVEKGGSTAATSGHGQRPETRVFSFVGRSADETDAELRSAELSRADPQYTDNSEQFGVETAVVVEGPALRHILTHPTQCRAFIELALRSCTVVACRCTPAQKAGLVRAIKAFGGLVTLAIGDGGNDVSMIQAADVGVGISGLEGQQAARAADYSLSRFAFLRRLLLVHGRLGHYRTALVGQYTFYKSQTLCFIQLMFNVTCGFSGCSLLDSFSLTSYNLLWTALPGLAMLLDCDRSVDNLLAMPSAFKESRQWRHEEGMMSNVKHYLSPRTFIGWSGRAVWQAFSILVVCSLALAEGGPGGASVEQQDLASLVFTALVMVQFLTVLTEMRSPTRYNAVVVCCSAALYACLQAARYSRVGGAAWAAVEALASSSPAVEAQERGSSAVEVVAVGAPARDWQATVLILVLAVSVAIGPWLPGSPCFLGSAQGQGIEDKRVHRSRPISSVTSVKHPGASRFLQLKSSLVDAARAVQARGRLVAGAMQQAASAVAAGDRSALTVAVGKVVDNVSRSAGSRSRSNGRGEHQGTGAATRAGDSTAMGHGMERIGSTAQLLPRGGARGMRPSTSSPDVEAAGRPAAMAMMETPPTPAMAGNQWGKVDLESVTAVGGSPGFVSLPTRLTYGSAGTGLDSERRRAGSPEEQEETLVRSLPGTGSKLEPAFKHRYV